MEGKEFNLVPVQGEDKTYRISNYDAVKAQCDQFIKDNSVFAKVEKPEDLKPCKDERKLLNERIKAVKNARLKVTEYYMGEFQAECKSLEHALQEASDAHSESIHQAEEAMGKTSKKTIRIIVSTYDETVAKQVEMYAQKLGALTARG